MTVASSLEEFENQLPKNQLLKIDVSEHTDRLINGEMNSIDIPKLMEKINKFNINPAQQQTPGGVVKIKKNMVLIMRSDSAGCGFIRGQMPFSFIDFVYGRNQSIVPIISNAFIYQHDILARTRTIWFQRAMSPQHLQNIHKYKELQNNFRFKMIHDMDDHIYDYIDTEGKEQLGVPLYNFGQRSISKDIQNSSVEIMKLMDLLVVSTQPMKDYYEKKLGLEVPVKVIKNGIMKSWWEKHKEPITTKIVKPKIIYTGSPTHYHNPRQNDQRKMYGDWENEAWREFVIKGVIDRKIEFTCMGGLPWFFESIKDKIKIIDWVNAYGYHRAMQDENADFGIANLVPNMFNICKSSLKATELFASSTVAVCSVFDYMGYKGPYKDVPVKLQWDCSLKDIEWCFDFYSEPENYNRIIQEQHDYMENHGHYLESKKFVNELVSII